ncbi:hypothetical protein PINS_up001804 [Pythium insidiosum]|nr:hypothetical protein PINS_up001804 [Pythium insidiosum]
MMTAEQEDALRLHSPRRVDDPPKAMGGQAAVTDAAKSDSVNANKQTTVRSKQPSVQAEDDDDDDDDDDGDDDENGDDGNKGKAKGSTRKRDDSSNADGDKTDDDKKASKKSRRELPPHTVAILKGWMLSPEHVKHPYPTDEDKQMLLKKTGINMKQLTNWFTNARKRIWKPMMRREHSRQLQNAMEYEKARPGEPYPGAAPYPDPSFQPRGVRHSYDAGSMGAPIAPNQGPYGPPYEHGGHHPGYPGVPPQATFPPRAVRSVSESATAHEAEGYPDIMRSRKRVHDMSSGPVDPDAVAHSEKRYRRGAIMSPRCLNILQNWLASHAEYPVPSDGDKLQLSRDTGLDVQQIEIWFHNNVGRHGEAPQSSAPSQLPPHGQPGYRSSIPSRENPMYPPPPAYGERRSIPGQGNPMFPPRPAARSSIPGMGNPQFPPPPSVRRESLDPYRSGSVSAAFPAGSGYHPHPPQPGFDGDARPMRSLSINAGQFSRAPSSTTPTVPPPSVPGIPTPVGAPGGLPSLANRALSGRQGPTMGQARDGRSHTLDMGLFAEARRRKMNFQDILASTANPPPAPVATSSRPSLSNINLSQPPNGENVYPDAVSSYAMQKPPFDAPSASMARNMNGGVASTPSISVGSAGASDSTDSSSRIV